MLSGSETSLETTIKAEALCLGFSLAGITSSSPPAQYPLFENWLENKYHAQMNYLTTKRSRVLRSNPEKLIMGCKTILVVGLKYPGPVLTEKTLEGHGKIAAYACSEDYHKTIPRMLGQLASFIQATVGDKLISRTFTDSAPILERELAARAGLGWIGKNGCLIAPDIGSFFLLGELFLSLELEPNQILVPDRCGNCQRCIEACPTQCILPNRTIDANRCLAYLTIEHRGSIPVDLRNSLGKQLFGCDICQTVCPWNNRPVLKHASQEKFQSTIELSPLLKMDDAAFKSHLINSAILRAKRSGLIRNAAIVLANQGKISDIEDLIHLLRYDPDPTIRAACAWSIGISGTPETKDTLRELLLDEKDSSVIFEMNLVINSN